MKSLKVLFFIGLIFQAPLALSSQEISISECQEKQLDKFWRVAISLNETNNPKNSNWWKKELSEDEAFEEWDAIKLRHKLNLLENLNNCK